MLLIANRMSELPFRALMDIYVEANAEHGQELWPRETPERQIALSEQDFYNYLQQSFFRTPGAYYAVWCVNGRCVSALRMEPYQDGWLLEALETLPDRRREGHAKALILAVLAQMGPGKVYSHVHKRNTASLRTHESCGFQKILDHAVYADGSVMTNSVTMCIER